MTVSLDDFSTDPSTRWTARGTSAYVWDSVNSEFDITTNSADPYMWHYTSTGTGSVESEAQVTFLMSNDAALSARVGGPMVRGLSATTEGYVFVAFHADYFEVLRYVNGARQDIDYSSPPASPGYIAQASTFNLNEWYTVRLAAEGAVDGNVTLKIWILAHGTTKPADPGWIGVDETPDFTFVDSQAARLDASGNSLGGICGRNASTDWDTRHSFYKQRAIADRVVSLTPSRMPYYYRSLNAT